MNRRKALKTLSIAVGGALLASGRLQAKTPSVTTAPVRASDRFTAADVATLDEIGETILPTTADSQGAKAAKIGAYMKEKVETQDSESDRRAFLAGIDAINALSRQRYQGAFLDILPSQRFELLLDLENNGSLEAYKRMRDMTVSGYFSSEIGATQALAHLPIPGRWDPCIEVGPEKKPWS